MCVFLPPRRVSLLSQQETAATTPSQVCFLLPSDGTVTFSVRQSSHIHWGGGDSHGCSRLYLPEGRGLQVPLGPPSQNRWDGLGLGSRLGSCRLKGSSPETQH